MKTKKISLIIIALLITQLFITIGFAEDMISVRGSVYIDDVLVMPAEIELTIQGKQYYAGFNQSEQEYGFRNIDANIGSIGTFLITIPSGSYYAEEQLVIIEGKNVYKMDLTVNTSSSEPVNTAPNAPYNPTPSDGATNQNRNVDLSWSCEDPDGDDLTYTVYFADTTPPVSMVADDLTSTSYDLGTLDYGETYYWQIIATDEYGVSTDGPIWQFTVINAPAPGDDDDDDDDVTPPGPSPGPGDDDDFVGPGGNMKPTAAATVDKNTGTPGETFNFDASDSEDIDGTIESYTWDFDDGTGEYTGVTISHVFSSAGTYEVMLTVEDSGGLTDTLNEPIVVEIVAGNNPPTDLTISPSETMTSVDTDVDFTISATDEDENDTITYTIDWDDTETMTSDPYNSAEFFMVTHQWDSYGVYTVTVTAEDSENATTVGTAEVWVDVYVIDDEISGWLIDTDSDGTYDIFRNTESETETELGMQDENKYLIDADGDDTWDYIFDMDTETLSAYDEEDGDGMNLALYVLAGLIVLLVIVFGYLAYKNKQDQKKKEQQKKQEKKSSESKKKKQPSTKSKRSK